MGMANLGGCKVACWFGLSICFDFSLKSGHSRRTMLYLGSSYGINRLGDSMMGNEFSGMAI